MLHELLSGITAAHIWVLFWAMWGAVLSTKNDSLTPLQRVLNTLCGLCVASLVGFLMLENEYKTVASSTGAWVAGLLGNRLTAELQRNPLGFTKRFFQLLFWARTGGTTPPPPDTDHDNDVLQ